MIQFINRAESRKGGRLLICAYDQNGFWIKGNMKHLHPLYKLLPVFMVLLV